MPNDILIDTYTVIVMGLIIPFLAGLLTYLFAKVIEAIFYPKSKKKRQRYKQKAAAPKKPDVPIHPKTVSSPILQKPAESERKYPYEKKMLLTKTEYAFYVLLKKECDKNHFLICPKVRMEDFLAVTDSDKYKYRGYIKSRHIDFMICDRRLYLLAGIELDDPSHWSISSAEVDLMKDKIFEQIKLPLFRVAVSGTYEDQIAHIIDSIKNPVKQLETAQS